MAGYFDLPKRKISGENGISWKVVQNSQTEFPNDYLHDFASLQTLSVNVNEFCKWYTPMPTKFSIREFLLTIWTNLVPTGFCL